MPKLTYMGVIFTLKEYKSEKPEKPSSFVFTVIKPSARERLYVGNTGSFLSYYKSDFQIKLSILKGKLEKHGGTWIKNHDYNDVCLVASDSIDQVLAAIGFVDKENHTGLGGKLVPKKRVRFSL